MADIVCEIQCVSRHGPARRAKLSRRGDPIAALDKICGTGTIARTDIFDVRCEPRDPQALTVRAVEASAAVIRFLASLPDGARTSYRRSQR